MNEQDALAEIRRAYHILSEVAESGPDDLWAPVSEIVDDLEALIESVESGADAAPVEPGN